MKENNCKVLKQRENNIQNRLLTKKNIINKL